MYDVIVIGGGAAGMTAALNILRNGFTCLLLEKESIGGQISTSPRVENFPSVRGITGADLSMQIFEQITELGCDFELEEVIEFKKEDNIFKVKTPYNSYEAKKVVLGIGLKHKKIGVEGEDYLSGISYCAVCDGAFYKNQEICVIGDANSALQYALLLSQYCKKVHLCMLFDRFFADKILIKKVLENPNIEIHKELSLVEFIGKKDVEGLVFKHTKTNELVRFDVSGCFIAIGQSPSTDVFKDYIETQDSFIVTNEKMQTKTEGLYAVGDCRNKKLRQLVTAMNDGSIAAYSIAEELS